VAIAETTAAILTNPAGLVGEERAFRVDLSLRLFLPSLRYEDALNTQALSSEPTVFAPSFGLVWNPNPYDDGKPGDWHFAAAVLHQGGFQGEIRTITQDYAEPGFERGSNYVDTGLHMAAAWRLSETVSVGATLSLLWSTFDIDDSLEVDVFRFRGDTPLGIPIGQLINQQFGVENLRIGGALSSEPALGVQMTFGLMIDLSDEVRFGISYRTPSLRQDYDTDVDVDITRIFGEPDPVTFPDGFRVRYEGEIVDFQLPQAISLGVAWTPESAWRLGLELRWINWSATHDVFRLVLRNGDNPGFNAFVGSDGLEVDQRLAWRDQIAGTASVEWMPHDRWVFRAGLTAQSNPVPQSAANPLAPGYTRFQAGLGVGYRADDWSLDLGWMHAFRNHAGSAESIVSSDYDDARQSFAADSVLLTLGIFF
ncbi:MAG: outer membrane protein transport protein, partial [Planctomycetes bacterium]|nr:outer membrane protein transport protein [Planctomycetota bacterium]